MVTNALSERRCSYVVRVQNAAASTTDLRDLAHYLSTLGVAGCDVVLLDAASPLQFEINGRILRWVGRHVKPGPEQCAGGGGIDIIRAAGTFAACEKVIVATDDVRYSVEAIGQMCELLEMHEVVEPQDYLDPLPWWGGVEAGRMLIQRGVEPKPDHGTTFGFRRGALRALWALGSVSTVEAQSRRLAAVGAEIHAAGDVFVRREAGPFSDWLSARPRRAAEHFTSPFESALFFSILPLLILLTTLGGLRLAGACAGTIAFGAVGMALHGRAGATAFFPMRACFLAPLWVFERSVSVYWALFRALRPSMDATGDLAGDSGSPISSGAARTGTEGDSTSTRGIH